MRRARERGYTLLEISVTLAVFGVFLWIIVILTAQMRGQEQDKRFAVNFMTHPEASAVVARIRRDVYDAKYYPAEYTSGTTTYAQSAKLLLLYCVREDGTGETVVYDFRQKGEVHRLTFSSGAQTAEWIARGVPDFQFDSFEYTSENVATRIMATDARGRLAIDQIFFPRPHA